MNNARKLLLAAAIASPQIMTPSLSHAEVALEEIVVTARKREESVQAIPVAVTAITGEMFERSLMTNFEEATALTPGFTTQPSTVSPQALSLSMRGSVQNGTIITADPSVGVYVDGVYIARAYGIGMDLLDLQNVQVLKGPQGTLFGRNSTAGALLLSTNNPDTEAFSGSVSLTAGNESTAGQVILNVPLTDNFAVRIAHQKNKLDDYITNAANNPNYAPYKALEPGALGGVYAPAKTTDSKIGGYDNETTRIKALFAPTDDIEMVLSWEQFESDLKGPSRDQVWIGGISTPQSASDDTVSLSFDPKSYAETETLNFSLAWDTTIGEVKFIYGDREYRNLNEADYDGGDWAAAPWDLSALYSLPPGSVISQRRHGSWGRTAGDQQSYELQLTTSFLDDKVDVTTGITYFEENADYFDYSDGVDIYDKFAGSGSAQGIAGDVHQEVEALGIYIQSTYHINDVSNLTLGLRKSEEDKSAQIWGALGGVLPTWDVSTYRNVPGRVPTNEDSKSFSSTDWLISYDYQISEDVMVYAKFSTGFRSGGFNGRPVGAGLPLSFAPEELEEFELGLKGDFLDNRLRWNTALFSNTTTDKQYSVLAVPVGVSATPASITKNAGESEAKGFETEFTYLLNENWNLSGSYAFIDAEVTSLIAYNPVSGMDEEVDANRRPQTQFIPENEWTLSVNYDQEFDAFNLQGTATYHWIDEMYGSPESAEEIVAVSSASATPFTLAQAQEWVDAGTSDAHGTLNLNLTISTLDDKYSASLWSKNVLDERAQQSSINFILAPFYSYATATYTQPRTFGVTLKAKF